MAVSVVVETPEHSQDLHVWNIIMEYMLDAYIALLMPIHIIAIF